VRQIVIDGGSDCSRTREYARRAGVLRPGVARVPQAAAAPFYSCRCPRVPGSSMTFARVGRNRFIILDHGEGDEGRSSDSNADAFTASPRASASTPINAGTSARSIGVDATQTPSRQWLSTTRRCFECLVTLSDAPSLLGSGMLRRFGTASTNLSMHLRSEAVDRRSLLGLRPPIGDGASLGHQGLKVPSVIPNFSQAFATADSAADPSALL